MTIYEYRFDGRERDCTKSYRTAARICRACKQPRSTIQFTADPHRYTPNALPKYRVCFECRARQAK